MPEKEDDLTDLTLKLAELLEQVNTNVQKQDGVLVDVLGALSELNKNINELTASAHKPEEHQQLTELLQKIEQHLKPKNSFKRAAQGLALGIAKAPFQLLNSLAKGIGVTVGLPSLIALGVHTGTGNDPMDIPCNVTSWSSEHFGSQAALTQAFSGLCFSTQQISPNNEQKYIPAYPEAPEGQTPPPPEDLSPSDDTIMLDHG